MSSISSVIKSIQDIMRKDAGIDGDAQRLGQLSWLLFLKVFDAQEEELEFEQDNYRCPIPERFLWRNWAADSEGLTGDALLDFVRSWTYGVVSYGVSQQLNLPALQAGVLKSIGGGVGVGGTVIRDISELRSFIASNAVSTPLGPMNSGSVRLALVRA